MNAIYSHIVTLVAGIAIGMMIALRACCPGDSGGANTVTEKKITEHEPELIAGVPGTITLPETPKRPKIVLRGRIAKPDNKQIPLPETGSAVIVAKIDTAKIDSVASIDSSGIAEGAQAELAKCPEFVAASDTTTLADGGKVAATYSFPANTFGFWYKAAADTTTTTTITRNPVMSVVVGATTLISPVGKIEYGLGVTIGVNLWSL